MLKTLMTAIATSMTLDSGTKLGAFQIYTEKKQELCRECCITGHNLLPNATGLHLVLELQIFFFSLFFILLLILSEFLALVDIATSINACHAIFASKLHCLKPFSNI
jgi:hypothetical protein